MTKVTQAKVKDRLKVLMENEFTLRSSTMSDGGHTLQIGLGSILLRESDPIASAIARDSYLDSKDDSFSAYGDISSSTDV